jgi:hypothetical protein
MIDLKRLLKHLDSKIFRLEKSLHWAESHSKIAFIQRTLIFLENLREALTFEEDEYCVKCKNENVACVCMTCDEE